MKRFRHSAATALLWAGILWTGPLQAAPPAPAPVLRWQFPLASNDPYNTSQSAPALAPEGTVYVATFDGTLFAVKPDGTEKWRFKAGREIKSAPAIGDDGTIYFGSRDRSFYAVTPGGKLKWSFPTGAWVDTSPALAVDGTVYFGGWDKTFYAFRPDGGLKWKVAIGAIIDSSPAIGADGTIYFGAHDRFFYALTPEGAVRWKFATGGAIIASPAIGAEGAIYFSSLDGNVYALNPDGTERWRYHTGGTTAGAPVLDEEENLYLPVGASTVSLSKTGQYRNECRTDDALEMPPAIVAGRIYAPSPWRALQCLTPQWERSWRAEFKENVSAAPMVDDQGNLYVCAQGTLYSLQPPGEKPPPARSSWPMCRGNARHTGRVSPAPSR